MSAMIYNPNNVATEASPYTTEVERQVGQELCEMLGYNGPDENPAPWGHITCVSVSAYGSRQWLSFQRAVMVSNMFSMLFRMGP